MKAIIEAIISPSLYKFDGTAAELRIYATKDFLNSDGQVVPAGQPRTQSSWYLSIACTVDVGGILYVPSFEIDSTVDGEPGTARYIAELYAQDGSYVGPFPWVQPSGFVIPAQEDQTWLTLSAYNKGRTITGVTTYPSTEQVRYWIQAAVSQQLLRASSTQAGNTALTTDPVDPTFPIAVGGNDYAGLLHAGITEISDAPAISTTPIALGINSSLLTLNHQWLTPQMYGALENPTGSSRPLSSAYSTLAAAQAVYTFATSLTQEIDWAAHQKMMYEALGYPSVEHAAANQHLNKAMYTPPGIYNFGADTLTIRNVVGMVWNGGGRRSTILKAQGCVFRTDGFWYSQVTGISFEKDINYAATTVVVDIDGNTPGHAGATPGHTYDTRGVQANTFKDCQFEGNGLADYVFAMTRLGNPGGGAQGSENLFLNCHFQGSISASYFSEGYNALNNTFIGGAFGVHQKDGIRINAGTINVYSVAFASTFGYTQIINDGYDISANTAGGGPINVIGCRTESARFYLGGASQPPVLIGNIQGYGSDVGWFANTGPSYYLLNSTVIKYSPTLGAQMYRVTTTGTTGGAEPTWPDSGTVTDGSVVWTQTPVDVVSLAGGTEFGNQFQFGRIFNSGDDPLRKAKEIRFVDTPTYKASHSDEFLLVDTTGGPVTIDLQIDAPRGKRYYIKRYSTDANAITITEGGTANIDNGGSVNTIPGGSRGWMMLEQVGGGNLTKRYYIVSRSLDPDPQIRRLRANQGTTLIAGDFALSAGFGTTASVAIVNASKDARGTITITSAGTGQGADPTVTLTFKDGAWPAPPFAVVSRSGGSQPLVPFSVSSISTTQLVLKFHGTPVAAETFSLTFFVES